MRYLNDYSDERLKGACAHCGSAIDSTRANRDHVPSKCLLQEPYPDNLPVVPSCIQCNSEFSKDEEYFSILLQCVLIGSADPMDHRNANVRKALRRSKRLGERIECSKSIVETDEESRVVWEPETQRVNNVILKNARGHAFYEFGERQEIDPAYVWTKPICNLPDTQHRNFVGNQRTHVSGWPEVGSRAFQRAILGYDIRDGWVIVQNGIYRYKVMQNKGVYVRSVLAEYLATEVYWRDDQMNF